jgi:hypothetical protein
MICMSFEAKHADTSVQTVVALPPDVRREIEARARDDGRTISGYLRKVVADHVKSAPAATTEPGQ